MAWVVATIGVASCGGDDASGTGGSTGTDGSTTLAGTEAGAITDAGSATGGQSTGGPLSETETDGTFSSSTTSDSGGTTTGGMPNEGDFADAYRLAFVQQDPTPLVQAVWVDVTVDGATAPELMFEDLTAPGQHWVLSPDKRWLAMQVATASGLGVVADTSALGVGAAFSWVESLALTALLRLDFLADGSGLAYLGREAAAGLLHAYVRPVADDGLGASVEVSPELESGNYLLAVESDQLLFQTADDNLFLTPAEPIGAQWVHVADIPVGPGTPTKAWLNAAASSAYIQYNEEIWRTDLTGSLPATATLLTLPEDPQGFRTVIVPPARNRVIVFDVTGVPTPNPPLHYFTIDGGTASPAYSFGIPEGLNGIGAYHLAVTADGMRAFVTGTTDNEMLNSLYAVDLLEGGSPTLTTLAGPTVDDANVARLALSSDEQTIYYATFGPDSKQQIKMVDASGATAPIDLAPGYAWQIATTSPQMVESEDGRAIFFAGYDETRPGALGVFRVGLVDGQPTSPVLMGEPIAQNEITTIYPAPDGGAVAYQIGASLMFSMYNDGDPTHAQVSSDGFGVPLNNTLPLYLPVP